MIDRVKAIIHLDNLIHNFNLLKAVYQNKRVMAVVKADAYGHGSVEVAKHLETHGCDFFAVTDLLEGIELRQAGIQSDILLFGKTSPQNIDKIKHYHLTQTIDSLEYAQSLNSYGIRIQTHIVIDTGMSRFGIYCQHQEDIKETAEEVEKMMALLHLNHQGIYTHFAAADEEKEAFTKHQYDVFCQLIQAIEFKGLDLGIKHCSNSAAILKYRDRHMDMVRTGIAMYGYPPIKTKLNFLPVMDVFARVISLRKIRPGDGISYGITHIAKKDMRLASIAIGYADGYNRLLSNQDYFFYKGKKLKVMGRVCMGVTMVDVSHIDIQVGDFVEVFGQNKPLDQMATQLNTITYELLTNMSKKRVIFEYSK
ncbi:alanine racemase [Mycoplasmatota bacterium]|nr:alanine racemase [Mycoplasmatota bacterium]